MDILGRRTTPVGENIPNLIRYGMGWTFIAFLLILVFGPMLLFSSLASSSNNDITDGYFEIGVMIFIKK